ncbi:RHS repeat-associated protein [Anaeroplasma bactoclasticum]|jgi:RHS repeat-associated protein|uniref:RHS repeat-associated protein n=1 Tax=Anaeroplasma bactoclasticum TaxID=2088 RepID=A0A397S530_9MOLU|nr:RHS repeat-associated core domain-containing protein [Anaeroplasma bactoclasticum]RIA77821.1 RHS repeat-associated protein [Anaeroplasma bactoclasticum]
MPTDTLSYTSSDKIMIGFWFKQEESSFSHLLTINQNNVYIGVFLDLMDRLHLIIEYNSHPEDNINVWMNKTVISNSWYYFGLEYYDDGNERKLLFELNDEIIEGPLSAPITTPVTYHIGYKYYEGVKTEVFQGGISNLMLGKDDVDEGYIYSYYLYTKNYIYNRRFENFQSKPYVSTNTYMDLNMDYDLIPLENNLKSINGIMPVRFDVNQDLMYDAAKNFIYTDYYERYCYLAYGNKLVYDFNFRNNGTVFFKGVILEDKDTQYFLTIKNEFGLSISIYRNQNKHIILKYDYYTFDTGYIQSLGSFTMGLSYNEVVNNNTRSITVFYNNSTFTRSLPLSTSFTNTKVYLGTDSNGNNALMGMIMDVAYKKEYVTSIPSSISTLEEYHKNYYYDSFGRMEQKRIFNNSIGILRHTYSYKNRSSDNTYTSLQVNKETIKIFNVYHERNYSLDSLGRVTSITDSTFGNHSYSYNALGYLSSDDNKSLTYDNNGNILSYGTNTYIYDNISRLVSYNNNSITYDTTHPFLMKTFNGYTYFYQGKRLVTATKNNKTINFTHDLEGLIIKKEVVENNTTTTTNYYYDNRRLVKEVKGNDVISYFYDNNNQLYGYKENNTVYFYIRDVLGNIIGILSKSGVLVSKFDYDAFGNIINQTGTVISNFRYKGYYYDTDLELYYLKSRFYNPVLLRFITPDSIEYLDSSSIIGLNLYAYCGNDPVMYVDGDGTFAITATALLIGGLIAGGIGAGIGLGTAIYKDYKEDGIFFNGDWTDYLGRTLGGFVTGFGIGVATVLGAGVGAAALGGTTASLFSSTGLSLSMGSAVGIGSGFAFATGMAGYTTRALISRSESYSVCNMFLEGGMNAVSGALSVLGGALGGYAGVHNTVFTRLLSQKGDLLYRILIENMFTVGFKISLAVLKALIEG